MDLALDDHEPPGHDDVLVSVQAVYRVIEVRPVESRLWPNRWHLTVVRVGDALDGAPVTPTGPGPSGRLFGTRRYRQGEGPADVFGPAG